MGWTCPECGFMNAEDTVVCTCGFDQSVFLSPDSDEEGLEEAIQISKDPLDAALSVRNILSSTRSAPSSERKAVAEKPRTMKSSFHPSDRITLKEVGSWSFSFSPSENKISVGTAALDPFRLDFSVEDIEEILEAVYEMTGKRKTLRTLELVDGDVQELVDFIGEMIDSKRSKIRPSFSPEDISVIAALINGKLSQ